MPFIGFLQGIAVPVPSCYKHVEWADKGRNLCFAALTFWCVTAGGGGNAENDHIYVGVAKSDHLTSTRI
jgi:hypothetical protein